MNKKVGGKQATGTPSLAWSCAVVIVSLLAGASVVHNTYKPDLTMPPGNIHGTEREQAEKKLVPKLENQETGV